MTVTNHAAALGKKIGNLFQNTIEQYLEPKIIQQNGTIKSEKILNGNNIKYDVDLVVRNANCNIVAIIETKFVRYKKHNRDKGSWIVNTHQNLRGNHPTITGCFAILGGNWSKPSLDMIQKGGIQIALVGFEHIADTYLKYGVNIRWEEKDDDMKKRAYEEEIKLSDTDRKDIGNQMIKDITPTLNMIGRCLASD